MIIKVKLGDLTVRQMKAICVGYKHCGICPLHSRSDTEKCFYETHKPPLDYHLDKEIEFSTDFVYPNKAVPFEEKIERLEKGLVKVWNETKINKCTLSRLAKVLGYKVGELHRLGGWHQIYESDYRCPADGKETADGDEEEWNKIHFKLRDGELGDPTDKKTLIKYWEMLRDAGYPFAQDQLNFLQEGKEKDDGTGK